MLKYKHIIWDWNGTLLNDAWLCVEVMNGVLKKRNLPLINLQKYKELFDFPVEKYYRRLGFNFDVEPFEVVGTEFIVQYDARHNEPKLYDGAMEVLQKIDSFGIGQSVLSAKQQNSLLENITYLGISNMFSFVKGLDNHYAHSKTELGLELLKTIGYPSREVLLIGDTAHDYQVARHLGCDILFVSYGHHSIDKLLKYSSENFIVNNLNEIIIKLIK